MSKESHRDYMRDWMRQRRAAFFVGKRCEQCSSTSNLELHHRNPKEKTTHKIWGWPESRRNMETAKCTVLCSGCHGVVTRLDLATRRVLNKIYSPGVSSGIPNVHWENGRERWRLEFKVMGRKVRPGGTGFRNLVTARLASESFHATLGEYYTQQGTRAAIACRKQYDLPLAEVSPCAQ